MEDDGGTDKLFLVHFPAARCACIERSDGCEETIIDLIGTFLFFLVVHFTIRSQHRT